MPVIANYCLRKAMFLNILLFATSSLNNCTLHSYRSKILLRIMQNTPIIPKFRSLETMVRVKQISQQCIWIYYIMIYREALTANEIQIQRWRRNILYLRCLDLQCFQNYHVYHATGRLFMHNCLYLQNYFRKRDLIL